MGTQLVILSLASAIGWEVFRYFWPGNINVRLAPLLTTGIAYGLSWLMHPRPPVILCIAAVGGVALFHKITDAERPDAITLPRVRRYHRRVSSRRRPGRIEGL